MSKKIKDLMTVRLCQKKQRFNDSAIISKKQRFNDSVIMSKKAQI